MVLHLAPSGHDFPEGIVVRVLDPHHLAGSARILFVMPRYVDQTLDVRDEAGNTNVNIALREEPSREYLARGIGNLEILPD